MFTPPGRPIQGDEPLLTAKTIKFGETMLNGLRDLSRRSGRTIGEEVRRAVAEKLNREKEVLDENEPNVLERLHLDAATQKRVDALVSQFGHASADALVAQIINRLSQKTPAQIHQILFGEILDSAPQPERALSIEEEAKQRINAQNATKVNSRKTA